MNFQKDFKEGNFVVGFFWDNSEMPALGVLESIKTIENRSGETLFSFSTSAAEYKIFRPIKSFLSHIEAETFIRQKLKI